MKYILILVEELQSGIPGDEEKYEEKYNICVSSDKEKLVEFRNKLSNAIKDFQIEKKNIEKTFIHRYPDLSKFRRERIELTSEINKIIETYSNKLDLDFERFRFVEETYFRFRIDKIKELV